MKSAIEIIWGCLTNSTWNMALVSLGTIFTIIGTIYVIGGSIVGSEHYAPIIVEKGGVIYTGISIDDYEKVMIRKEHELINMIESIKEEEREKRLMLVGKLTLVRGKLNNLESSYREMQKSLKEAEEFLLKYSEKTGDLFVLAARSALNKGDIDKAINIILAIYRKYKAVEEEAQSQLTSLAENFAIELNKNKSKQWETANNRFNEAVLRETSRHKDYVATCDQDEVDRADIKEYYMHPSTRLFGPEYPYLSFYRIFNTGPSLGEVWLKDIGNGLEWSVDSLAEGEKWMKSSISDTEPMQGEIIVDAILPSGDRCRTRLVKGGANQAFSMKAGDPLYECAINLYSYSENVLDSKGGITREINVKNNHR